MSLLDVGPEDRVIDWYVLFHPREPHRWWVRFLKPGFRHVDLMRPLKDSWLVLRLDLEILENHVEFDPTPPWIKYPEATIIPVTVLMRAHKSRRAFHIGPFSCVEFTKAALGITSFWLRTPFQLYKYLHRRNGILGV
jgi:hypothetical protein